MSINLVGRPKGGDELNPVYNPVVYYFDSTNKNEEGFRYIAQIKKADGTFLFEKEIIPDPDTGYCNLHLNRDLQDFVSFDFGINPNGNPQDASNSYLRFDIEVGEAYGVNWAYDGMIYLDDTTPYWPNAGNPQYNPPNPNLNKHALTTTSAGSAPPFSAGDTIFVEITTPGVLPNLGGFHKVLDVFNAGGASGFYWTVVLDITYQGAGTSAGTIRFADNRKTRFLNLYALEDQVIFNGVFSPADWLNWDQEEYSSFGTINGQKWLTVIPTTYKIREDNTIFLNVFKKLGTTIANGPRYWYFQSDDGSIARITSFQLDNIIRQIDVSPTRTNWGTLLSGTLPIIKPDTEWYEVFTSPDGFARSNEVLRFEIDRSCTTDYEDIEMNFVDALGSRIPFNFTLRNVETRKITKSNYVKFLGGIKYQEGPEYFGYDLEEGGKETYDESFVRIYTLRTDFLNAEMSKFFHNLIQTPKCAIKIDGEFQSCVITTLSKPVKKRRWFEPQRYEIEVMLSNRNKVNV